MPEDPRLAIVRGGGYYPPMGMPDASRTRILVIDGHRPSEGWLARAPALPYRVEVAHGSVDALNRLRHRAFEVVVTSPDTHVAKDLALLEEMERIRPGLKVIILAPAATPDEVIASLRARVFGCFTAPLDPEEIAAMIVTAAEATEWTGGIQVLSARPEWIALRVTCSLLTADRLIRFMTELRADIPEDDRDDLLTAFREILMNAMEHGAGFDPEKVVEVSAVRTGRAIVYYFRDPGPGFPSRAPLPHTAMASAADDPIAHLEQRAAMGLRAGGFGMLIARQLVNEVIYSEAGNEVLLIKHTAP